MFIEPRVKKDLKAPEERNVWLRQVHCAPPELEIPSVNWSYRHLAALRPGTSYGRTLGVGIPGKYEK
jgi:hypothetical protein